MQRKIPCAKTKTRCSQIDTFFFFKKEHTLLAVFRDQDIGAAATAGCPYIHKNSEWRDIGIGTWPSQMKLEARDWTVVGNHGVSSVHLMICWFLQHSEVADTGLWPHFRFLNHLWVHLIPSCSSSHRGKCCCGCASLSDTRRPTRKKGWMLSAIRGVHRRKEIHKCSNIVAPNQVQTHWRHKPLSLLLLSHSVMSDSLWPYLFTFSYSSWVSQGKNAEVVCHSLLG